jgi:sulfite reductase beta subunit-like hemoprotein
MLRVRIPACEMTAELARVLAFIAYSSGHEIVDLTTRGNLQIQGLPIGKISAAIQAIESVGLTSKQTGLDNVRNVTSHSLSGIDPGELIDTREAARAVTTLFIDSRSLADLPRKFNIAVSGAPHTAPQDWTQDIAWLDARGPDSTMGYRLLIGGMQGPSPHLGQHLPFSSGRDSLSRSRFGCCNFFASGAQGISLSQLAARNDLLEPFGSR